MKNIKNAPCTAATKQSARTADRTPTSDYDTTTLPKSQDSLYFWPTVWETTQAEKIFTDALKFHAEHNSKRLAIELAICEVWRQARIFEANRRA